MLTLRDIVQANKTSFVAVNLNFTICQRETEFKKFFGSKLNLKIENQRIKSSKVSKQKRKRVFCCLHCVVISVFKNKSKFSFQTRTEHKGNCPHTRWGVDSINVSSHVKFFRCTYNYILLIHIITHLKYIQIHI